MKRLIEIQQKLVAPKNQYNKFGEYYYRSCEDILNAVKPLLKEQKLALVLKDDVVLIGERYYIKAIATIYDDTGKEIASTSALARESFEKKKSDDSQLTGAASSYARKYALNGLFCIDDVKDSDATNKHGKEEPKQTQTKEEETKNAYITLVQKNQLRAKLGGAEFAQLMNKSGNKLTVEEFEKIMGAE